MRPVICDECGKWVDGELSIFGNVTTSKGNFVESANICHQCVPNFEWEYIPYWEPYGLAQRWLGRFKKGSGES